jgi:hypothetical protein
MTEFTIFNKNRCKSYRLIFVCVALLLLLGSCGSDPSGQATSDGPVAASSDSGSASFAIQWHADSTDLASGSIKRAMEDCAGVASITCEVYDDANNPIASGGPWSCSDHHGTIENIPAGSGRRIAALGWSATGGGGNAVYQGQTAGITITPGQTTNVGTIGAYAFVPTGLGTTVVPDNRIDLDWNDIGYDAYRIYRNGAFIDSSTSTNYSDTNLSANTEYCYTVSAIDSFGNESGPSSSACATATGTCSYSVSPDSDSFGASADTGTITVTTDNGCTWSAIVTSGANWITITSEASGSGTGDVIYSVAANNDANQRNGVISVAGHIFNITQAGVTCAYSISPPSDLFGASADTGSITVTANSGCTWSAVVTSGADWITITSGTSGSGIGNVNYSVAAYTGTNTRYGVISVAGYDFNISQEGVTVTCTDYDSDGFFAESDCGTAVDCADRDPNIYPGATEICNGQDDNCDGTIDEGCAAPVLSNPDYSLVGLNDTEDPQGGLNYSTFNLGFSFYDNDGDANEAAGATLTARYQFTGGNFFEVDHTDALVGVDGYEGTVRFEENIRFDNQDALVVTFILTDGAGHNSNSLQMTIDRPSGAN